MGNRPIAREITLPAKIEERLRNAYSIPPKYADSANPIFPKDPPPNSIDGIDDKLLDTFSEEILSRLNLPTLEDKWVPLLDEVDPSNKPISAQNERQIEVNIEELARLRDHCRQLKSDYLGYAKQYLDTRLAIEEFGQLDRVHIEEIQAGLYFQPWVESLGQKSAADNRSDGAKQVMDCIDRTLSNGELGPKKREEVIGAAFLEFVQANKARDGDSADGVTKLGAGNARVLAIHALDMAEADWRARRATTSAVADEAKSLCSAAERKARYLFEDIWFRAERTSVARRFAYRRLVEHSTQNGELTYLDRMMSVKATFSVYVQRMIETARALERGISTYYHLPISAVSPKKGESFEYLCTWMAIVQSQLSAYRRAERTDTFAFSLKSASANPHDLEKGLRSGLKVSISKGQFVNGGTLLRGVAAEFVGKSDTPIGLRVTLPQADANSTRSVVHFGRVPNCRNIGEIRPQFFESVWNIAPFGDWDFQMDPNDLGSSIEDVLMHVWLAR